ncbi:type IV secretion system protein [Pseudorhodobacter ferrugineus]|uniref:type IV secretion system protein n=1 Tax=Pseudorhodobacter ferrugineus TaxID=77008 RepID=UPI0003B66607|nr:type IV secretion system protein [Pseudorhodobacter ferrugineus]
MIRKFLRGLPPFILSVTLILPIPSLAQGVPIFDIKSFLKLGEVLTEAKLQVKEQIASNLKLDDQILKQIQQILLLEQQLKALKEGLTLEALGIPDPKTFFDDILPDVNNLTGGLLAAKDGSYSSMTTSGKVGGKPAETYVSEFFTSVGLDVKTVDALAKSENPGAARIGTQANTAAFLSAAAETSSVKASESLGRVNDLVQAIPGTEGMKEAIDLNTRVTAELSIALANIWNMESAQLMGMGEAGVMDAATAAEEQKFIKVLGEK